MWYNSVCIIAASGNAEYGYYLKKGAVTLSCVAAG